MANVFDDVKDFTVTLNSPIDVVFTFDLNKYPKLRNEFAIINAMNELMRLNSGAKEYGYKVAEDTLIILVSGNIDWSAL